MAEELAERPSSDDLAEQVVIIGGGIGGLALALALQQRGVRCLVVERDTSYDQRRGYGLTLSNVTALAALDVEADVRAINQSCVSDCHWVFNELGAVLGYFGIAFTKKLHEQRGNLRVPRVVLRRLLFERLAAGTVQWGWKLRNYEEDFHGGGVTAFLEPVALASKGHEPSTAATGDNAAPLETAVVAAAPQTRVVRGSVLIGADGVRSVVRTLKFGDPHRYVGVVVVLGVSDCTHPLTQMQGFYTVDGVHRMFTMPYEPIADGRAERNASERAEGGVSDGGGAPLRHTTMWQLSWAEPDEVAARALCASGGAALLDEVRRRCAGWHVPVPAMLASTAACSVWGTCLVDRAAMPLRKKGREDWVSPWRSRVTLVGDAAHCMTPFKGQGANQSLADASLLARYLAPALTAMASGVGGMSSQRDRTSRLASALANFEREMSDRAQPKVEASREAAVGYHSATAVDPTTYGIEGVPPELMGAFRAALCEEGIGAQCGAELERRALETLAELIVREERAPLVAAGPAC